MCNPRQTTTMIAMATVAWFVACSTHVVYAADVVYGVSANPTGQPIGGGAGYTAGPKRSQASIHVNSLDTLERALAKASPGQVVWIASGSEIDLEDRQITVPERVILAGDRGVDGALGPCLTAKLSSFEWRVQVRPGARLTGLRIVGPNPLFKEIDQREFVPSAYAVACDDAEVDNCEISQFQRGGIALFRNSTSARIHHNHLHDIAAYPVLIANGSGDDHLIEANRIEWAWHAVGSNGSRGSGYTVRYNEFLRVPRPKLFEKSGPSPPNWCLDVHANDGVPTKPQRPFTRKLVVHHNTFLAHPDVKVGSGLELLATNGLYPKHDIYVGPCPGSNTTVDIHHNRFLMHATSGSNDKFKPYGRAIRIVGLHGHPALADDPQLPVETFQVTIADNKFSGQD